MITLADLKSPGLWKFQMHADGSDKGGRFSINFYEANAAGVTVRGWKKQWRDGKLEAGYRVYPPGGDPQGELCNTLAEVLTIVNNVAGDDARGVGGDD